MGRGSTKDLIRKTMECLKESPKTASEISEHAKLDKSSVAKYLNILKDGGFLNEEEGKEGKVYSLVKSLRPDTYFGLPLSRDVDQKIDSLYAIIRQKYLQKTGRTLLKTTAQKIIYKVAKDCDLKIPVGWYVYGGVCIKPYDDSAAYSFKGIPENVEKCVEAAVEDFSQYDKAYESKKHQYKEEGKKLYDIKEDILRLIYSKNFSKRSMYVFQKKYAEFIRLAPRGDKAYEELIEDYQTLLIDIVKYWDDFVSEKNDGSFSEFKRKIVLSFENLWRLVALFNFKKDLSRGHYSEAVLHDHFRLNIEQAKEELIQAGSDVNGIIPFEEPDRSDYKRIKGALKRLNEPRSEAEIKKQNEELKSILKEKGLEAYNKELFKRAGLD